VAHRKDEHDNRVPSKADNPLLLRDIQMDGEKIKLGLCGALGGAIVLAIIGFA
jgi:hypothetical protein